MKTGDTCYVRTRTGAIRRAKYVRPVPYNTQTHLVIVNGARCVAAHHLAPPNMGMFAFVRFVAMHEPKP